MAYEPKTWECGDRVTVYELNRIEQGVRDASMDGDTEYTPHEWRCGEVVTADLLNHIEQGVANASSGGAI